MSNPKYDWEEIFSDTAQLIAELIRDEKDVPKTFPELYKMFEKHYCKVGKEAPSERMYVRQMRSKLKIANNKRFIQAELYRLTGDYDKMSLKLLADSSKISTLPDALWLFVQMKSENKADDRNSHFYHVSRKLKEKFKNDIIFISFDTDTIVILCADNKAKSKILSYFNSLERRRNDGKKAEV